MLIRKTTITLFLAISICAMTLLLTGCKEINPAVVPPHSSAITDTTYIESPVQSPTAKYALIEEVTGVSCPNCPASHVILDGLISSQNVIGVSYHVGAPTFQQDAPIVQSPLQVMTSSAAKAIVTYSSFYYPGDGPLGMVDRVVFNNGNSFASTLSQGGIWNYTSGWGGDATTETTGQNNYAPVNINLTSSYSGGKINITVSLHYTTNQPDTDYLSVFLTEDSIVTAQQLADQSVDTFYVHNHIMRDAVSAPLGDIINIPTLPTPGRVVVTTYQYPNASSAYTAIPAIWNVAHMHVVAFVHRYQNSSYNILQAAIIPISH
jgi:hypothetical protein